MVICIVSESGCVGILVCDCVSGSQIWLSGSRLVFVVYTFFLDDVGLDLSVLWLMSFFFLMESLPLALFFMKVIIEAVRRCKRWRWRVKDSAR